MASLLNIEELKERQQELITRAREMFDKAIESGKSYVEVTRSNIESEVEDLFGKVREFSAKGQATLQTQASKQIENVQKLQHDLVGRAEALLEQYGPEIEKRLPAAASAVELAEQLLKSADERLKALLNKAVDALGAGFPIKNYADLTVAEIKKALAKLSRAELEIVKAYEAANKARKSVLADIESLLKA